MCTHAWPVINLDLGGRRHRGARVHPLLFERMPSVEREIGEQLVLGKHLAHDPACFTGRIFGAGIEENVRAVRGDRDVATEPATRVVLHLMFAQGLNHPPDLPHPHPHPHPQG